MNIEPGIYRHFKGGIYLVLGIAKHSETQEELVIYKSLKTKEFWVRPISMFNDIHSSGVKRFVRQSDAMVENHRQSFGEEFYSGPLGEAYQTGENQDASKDQAKEKLEEDLEEKGPFLPDQLGPQ